MISIMTNFKILYKLIKTYSNIINWSCKCSMQDEISNSHEMEVEVSDTQAQTHRRKFEQLNAEIARVNTEYQSSEEKVYYLLSCKFLLQWKKFCLSTSSTRVQPQPINSDLINKNGHQLVQGLIQSQNFIIVDKKVMEIFDGFPIAATLRRVAYGSSPEKRVPIYTIPFKYLTLNQKDLQLFDKSAKRRQNLVLKQIRSLSLQNNFEDLIKQIQYQQMLNKSYDFRLWYHKKDVTLDTLYSHIIKQCKPLSYEKMVIRALGKKLEMSEQKIGSVEYEDGCYFVLQCIQYSRNVLIAEDEGRCEECRNFGKLNFVCACKQAAYCSQKCYDADRRYHMNRCKFLEQEQLNKPVAMNIRQNSRRGLVGLQNLGNTCFMNSCLQCLSHTLLLTNYFLNSSYMPEINRDNPIGSKGKLVQSYANFIKNMWCEQENCYRPSRLKLAIADINKMFSGYAQHDSQQLFSFLVDGLHQDLNRIKKKPYVESVDSNGRADDIVSRESWLAYIQRNQSIITDTMVGQYKSKVICPDCKRQSITFDPFITVTLPIPQKSWSQLKLLVIYSNFSEPTKKINVYYKNKNIEQIIQKTAHAIQRKKSQFRIYVLTYNQNIYPFDDTPKTDLFLKMDTLSLQTGTFAIELSPEQQKMANRIQLVTRFSRYRFQEYESLWFKRPFFFNFKTTTGRDIAKRVLKFLYQAYKQKMRRQMQQRKNFEEYQEIMLKSRPFKIYLREGKTLKKKTYSSYLQTVFKQQNQIEDDQFISPLINIQNIGDYELDIRFSNEGLTNFQIVHLDKSDDNIKRMNNDEEDDVKATSLGECFEALEQPEQLQQGNQWYCGNCKEHKLAYKQLFIYKTPEILILHLKRFKQKGIYRKQKNETVVDFPFELNMEAFITNPQPINAYIPFVKSAGKYVEPSYNLEVSLNSPLYELYAVSNHYGGLGGGHYTAYAKNRGKWFSFNDSSVSAVSPDRVKGSGAYILFYRRKQQSQ